MVTLSEEQIVILRSILDSQDQSGSAVTRGGFGSPSPGFRRQALNSFGSASGSSNSSANSSFSHDHFSDPQTTDRELSDNGEQGYSTDEMLSKKGKNKGGSDAQKFLLVS